MVDNLGGILSEGTLAQKRAYYEQIAHQCAQINNDNVLTLQKINDAALSTLLLRKLARCQERICPSICMPRVRFASIRRCHLPCARHGRAFGQRH